MKQFLISNDCNLLGERVNIFDGLLFRASRTGLATKMYRGENEEADNFVINCSFVIKLYNELAQAF